MQETDPKTYDAQTMAAVPADHPLTIAWEKYKLDPSFNNTKRWAYCDPKYTEGSLWAAFEKGWRAAYDARAAGQRSLDEAPHKRKKSEFIDALVLGILIGTVSGVAGIAISLGVGRVM